VNVVERWQALDLRRRVVISAGAAAAIAIVALAIFLGRDTRVALFANPLFPDQLAEVDAQLSAWNVAFTPVHDNVRVDAKHRSELLARLALSGVPHAHVAGTAEALASVGTLTPQAILDAQARAGLEGDLEKGLRGLGGIADARVIIAPAHGGIFADDSPSPATASVRVNAQPGGVLTESTLAAVRAFVASGVPGLDATHVTVIDERGTYDPRQNDDARQREASLQSALDAAFGTGSTIVRVHVERTQSASESHDVRRAPHERVPITSRDFDERLSSEKKTYTRRQKSEDRGSDVHDERTILAAGSVARISVAVIVDARRNLDLDKIREVAAAAAGFDPHRGDALSVDSMPFDRPYSAAPQPFAYAAAVLGEALPAIVAGIVVIVAMRTASGPLFKFLAEMTKRVRLERTAPEMRKSDEIFEALRDEPPHVAAAIIGTLATPLAMAVLDLYGAEERRAIVARMGRARSPLVAGLGVENLLQ
jgi:flagellar M-ring protein FliF